MSIQTKTNNSNLFYVLSFENEEDRISFSKYLNTEYQIRDFNIFIDENSFFDISIKKEEVYEENIEMSRNNDYTTGNLIDYEYFSKHYKLIAIDSSN